MQWEGKEEGGGVEDRRGIKPGVAAGGGIIGLIIFAVAYFVTGDANKAKNVADQASKRDTPTRQADPAAYDDRMRKFSNEMLTWNDKIWAAQLPKAGWQEHWVKPNMVLFSDEVRTGGCGVAPSAVGPFYCPADKTVYLDPAFFDELESKLGGSKADFSQAYVIAHEVGHHIQNIVGYNQLVEKFRAREGENSGIRLELQADYLAGVWAKHAEEKYHFREKGDLESAIKTAKNIGDDAIQKKMQGWTSPEKYNHGTADQRYKYFMKGFETGDASKEALDKFSTPM